MRCRALAALALATLLGPMSTGAHAQSTDDEQGTVPHIVRDEWDASSSVPQAWEEAGVRLSLLTDAVLGASSEDNAALSFDNGGELGSFRPAPEGGSPFFGAAAPLFGMGAPTVGPDGTIRSLDADDRFLPGRDMVEADTVIPPLGSTPDASRSSFAFIGEIPPIGDDVLSSGGPRPPVIDVPTAPLVAGPTPGTTTPTLGDAPAGPLPLPGPNSPLPQAPTSAPPVLGSPTTTPSPTTAPGTPTTAPPTPTTVPNTPTTRPPALPTTTQPQPVSPPPPDVGASLVLGNQREGGTQCFSNDDGATHNPDCDQLFDIGGGMRPGRSYTVDLTLWNAEGRSDTDAAELRTYAPAACDPSGGGADLCEAIELTIQRYTSSDRSVPAECVYGGGSGATCAMSSSHTLGAFARAHTSMVDGARVVPGAFRVRDRAYLRISVRLPDLGFTEGGIGRSNPYSGQTASWSLRWEMRSA